MASRIGSGLVSWCVVALAGLACAVPRDSGAAVASPGCATSSAAGRDRARRVLALARGSDRSTFRGVTIWRLRPAKGQPDGARLLVQEGGAETAWVAERVDADAPLDVGDRVRLSFESARAGFLYVIDREHTPTAPPASRI